MKVGDLVRTTNHPSAKAYPKTMGIVTYFRDEGLNDMYNTAHVLWPDTGEERPVRQLLLEVVSEGG